jgi:hypothetical protein
MRRSVLYLALFLAPLAQAEDWLYLTYPGDTLIGIGKSYLKNPNDWPKIQSANKVPIPKHLPANTRIKIPVELLKVEPAPAKTTHVQGNVRVRPENGSFKPLTMSDLLQGGETVLTGPKSFAAFELADGSKVNLGPSAKLSFGRLAKYGATGMVSTELVLDAGRMEAKAAQQLQPAGGFKVATPVAVAGLRGTAFRLNLDDTGKTLASEVLAGAVAVDGKGKEVLVGAGTGSIASDNAPPTEAIALLPAPALSGLPDKVMQFPLRFAWAKDHRATAWRSEVASDAAFQRVMLDQLSAEPGALWDDTLPDGHYFLRVRMKDKHGLEGFATDHVFELDARPLPPPVVKPADGERSLQETVQFTWAAPEEAHGYRLQIATSQDFSQGLIERQLAASTGHSQALPTGRYYWRLASLDDRGVTREWGQVQTLRVQPLPDAPAGTQAKSSGGKAELAWLPTPGADAYEVAISQAADLSSSTVHKAKDAKASLELKPGQYYWRVRGIEADGQAGAWSGIGAFAYANPPSNLQGRTEGDTLVLTWEGSSPAYRLEFASDPEFKQVFFRHRQEGTHSRLSKPLPQKYWVRVLSLDSAGGVGETGPTLGMQVATPFPWWVPLPAPQPVMK